jgi:hypothetical protein
MNEPGHIELAEATRRNFLTSAASGLGLAALSAAMSEDKLLASTASAATATDANPLAPRGGHFAPRAKACIFIFMEGAPSQVDLFDPKPKLNELHGQKLPDSMTKNVRFAFLKKDTARLMGTKRKFSKHGQSGMELSELIPYLGGVVDDLLLVRSMHTDQFNHHPGQLLMQCGRASFGLPCMGSWLTYGLGCESRNLPGYVVLSAGRGSSGGSSLWQSGFLPSVYSGVLFRNKGEPVLNLQNPAGMPDVLQRASLDVLARVNQAHFEQVRDPEIASRIASYELAFRMQASAPELIDLKSESQATLDMYGVERAGPKIKAARGGGPDQFAAFATNCLLARRMVERGVRFVNIIHASWDHHSNLDTELPFNAEMADQPIAALIKDLKQRGLLDSTLVVWASEFGRTPLGENRNGSEMVTGRDHHPFAFSIFMAGGGTKGGLTYGETDEIGWGVTKDPVHINDFQATLLHLFGLDHLKLTHRFQGRDFRLTDVGGKVVNQWLA